MNIAVFGTQWGDEGKGKIVDYLAKDAEIVARFQGGCNAGHTVVVGNKTLKLHLIPSGVVYNKRLLVGNGAVINPEALISEVNELRAQGFSVDIMISERAHLTLPYHIALDTAADKSQGSRAAGSTQRGIAPTYADKYSRDGLRVIDLLELYENNELEQYINKMVDMKSKKLKHIFNVDCSLCAGEILSKLASYVEFFRKHSGNVTKEIYEAIASGKPVLFEGAQGGMLDIDHGLYPYTTSSNTTIGGLFTGLGLGTHCRGKNTVDKVIGVVKAYMSRVGAGPVPTEMLGKEGEIIREKGNEYGATTGRPRRIAWLDANVINNFIMVNGIHEIALTKLDVLSGFKELKICTAYEYDGKKIACIVAAGGAMGRCKPEYETLPGWNENISKCRKFKELPANAQQYVRKIEELTKTPVTYIGVGAERGELIVRD